MRTYIDLKTGEPPTNYCTHIYSQQIWWGKTVLLHPGVEEHATSAIRAELVMIPLATEGDMLQIFFTTLQLQPVALRIHKQIAITFTDGAVALDDLLFCKRRGEFHGVLYFSAKTDSIVCLKFAVWFRQAVEELVCRHLVP